MCVDYYDFSGWQGGMALIGTDVLALDNISTQDFIQGVCIYASKLEM